MPVESKVLGRVARAVTRGMAMRGSPPETFGKSDLGRCHDNVMVITGDIRGDGASR